MTEVFDKLKIQLAASGTLTDAEIGDSALTDDERLWLSAERHSKQRSAGPQITLDEYLAANKTLDSAAEGSPEYEAALKIAEAYESGA